MYSMVMLMALSTGASEPVTHGGGGCYGGCYGGGYGCAGYNGGCHGRSHGGCYGSSCHGGNGFLFGGGLLFGHRGHGCNGGCYGGGYGGCYGGGYGGCYGGGCNGGIRVEPVPVKPGEKPKEETNQATIIVNIPANAKLTIDNNPTISTTSVRTFSSPALEVGKEYVYTLKAEIAVNGKTEVVSKEITVRANEVTRVTIETPVTTTASK